MGAAPLLPGLCVALTGHHASEDRTFFPAVAAAHPELGELERAVDRSADTHGAVPAPGRVAAVMESHFRYEERHLLGVLGALGLDADPREALGPL